ncbi:MAG: hypothetical protein AMS22_18025 [Thiotrichales bacterium SG8_50]|nr:MAG: hypothetical protein AMS22_18025 [Thiotrichales bacterium SG8_50]
MIEIDGSTGEGGGQLVRTACALSALTGTAIRLFSIRARRAPPGLAPQHLTAVRAVAALCGAEVEGLEVRASEIRFRPQALRGGEYRFDVGTAGSITLVLQAVLPVAFACPQRFVFLPLLERIGLSASLTLHTRGYYPRGGGEVTVDVRPGSPRCLVLDEAGKLEAIGGVAHVANLPVHIVERMQDTAEQLLRPLLPAVHIKPEALGPDRAIGAGGAIALWARTSTTLLGGGAVAQRGIPAERIARDAAEPLLADLRVGATLDLHAVDQLLIYLARAPGESRFQVRALTTHAETCLWLLRQFLPLEVNVHAEAELTSISLRAPRGD